DTLLGTVTANWYRWDLANTGKGNGQHAFLFLFLTQTDVSTGRLVKVTFAARGGRSTGARRRFSAAIEAEFDTFRNRNMIGACHARPRLPTSSTPSPSLAVETSLATLRRANVRWATSSWRSGSHSRPCPSTFECFETSASWACAGTAVRSSTGRTP